MPQQIETQPTLDEATLPAPNLQKAVRRLGRGLAWTLRQNRRVPWTEAMDNISRAACTVVRTDESGCSGVPLLVGSATVVSLLFVLSSCWA